MARVARLFFFAGVVGVFALAMALRLPDLGNRPMHADEAVHAVKFRELYERGVYVYDANEFHGPTLYYAALPVMAARHFPAFPDTREADYRLTIALCGAALTLLPLLLRDALGRAGVLTAMALLAISPASVFYSRYYIQETPLALFTTGVLVCLWRYSRTPLTGWAVSAGVCLGGMIASKETFVLALVALAVGAGISGFLMRRDPAALRHVGLAAVVGLAVGAALLSNFGKNPVAILDYCRSYLPWLGRAGGTGLHRQPFAYYLTLLIGPHRQRGGFFYSEAFLLILALVGIVAAYWPRRGRALTDAARFHRFLAVYAVTLTLIYSAIPYKTPWCVLSFLTAYCLLAGVAVSALWGAMRHPAGRAVLVLILLTGIGHLTWQSYRADFVAYADPRNPYVYSPTSPDVEELAEQLARLTANHPDHENTTIAVLSTDEYYWPLPWYLRRFPNIGYWAHTLPADIAAPLVIASPEFEPELTRRLGRTHQQTGFFGLRSGVVVELWAEKSLWKRFLAAGGN